MNYNTIRTWAIVLLICAAAIALTILTGQTADGPAVGDI